MNPSDLPLGLVREALPDQLHDAQTLRAAVHALVDGPLRQQAEAIDRGLYPKDILQSLAAAGAMSAHLEAPAGHSDFALCIDAMAEASAVCGATGFMMWCHAVCGLYMQQSGNPALTQQALQDHAAGLRLGGTAMSNPMKSYAQIEGLLLKATPVADGFIVNGNLPWVSNLGPEHYCGALAGVDATDNAAAYELMFMVRCDAPGVELHHCPSFSGMEGTGTYALRLNNYHVGADDLIAAPCKPYIARIRAAFILLQCGMGLGVTQGAIDSMWQVEPQLGHVNQFLEDRPADLQAELDALKTRIHHLAHTPYCPDTSYLLDVLDARAHCSEISLRAAQSALMHQGARGYLLSSAVQRRVRESHFVAIVTPAIKHLRKEIARLSAEVMPA
jgi:alkylation response protein AidB-like acyl-CoA dehydrogenase